MRYTKIVALLVLVGVGACSREPTLCSDADTVAVLKVLIEGVEQSPENLRKAASFISVADFTEKLAGDGSTQCSAKYTISKDAQAALNAIKATNAADMSAFKRPNFIEYKLRVLDDSQKGVVVTNFDLAKAQRLQRLHALFLNPPDQASPPEAVPPPEEPQVGLNESSEVPDQSSENNDAPPPPSAGPGNRGDFSTPKTTIATEFYRHLGLSDVESAGAYVVPEKRNKGPVSRAAADFYNSLREPLQLDDVQIGTNERVFVRYSFQTADGKRCLVSSALEFSRRGEELLIEKIVPKSECH